MGLLFNVGALVLVAHAVTSKMNGWHFAPYSNGVEGPVIRVVPRSILPPSDKTVYLRSDEIYRNANQLSEKGFPETTRRKRCTQYGCSGGYQPPQPYPPYYPGGAGGCVGWACSRPCTGYRCSGGDSGYLYPVGGSLGVGLGYSRARGR